MEGRRENRILFVFLISSTLTTCSSAFSRCIFATGPVKFVEVRDVQVGTSMNTEHSAVLSIV